MKVAYLFGSLNRGGTETLMLDVCKKLQQTDFAAIGVYRKKGILEKDFLETQVPFHYLPTQKNKLKYIWQLRKLLLKNKITIIHAQQPIDAFYAYFACLGTGIKLFLTLHGFDFSASKKLHSFILKRTDKNIYVSNYQKEYYQNKYKLLPKGQCVVYNGVNFDKLANTALTEPLPRKKNRSPQATLKFAMVGNFVLGREQNTVCKFLKLLKNKGVDFDFYFVGKKNEATAYLYDDCVAFCKENKLDEVHFLGSRNDVPAILQNLDAFIYSTDHDTFGIAVIEAIASALPVFVNDWEVMEEITEQGKLATLYKTKDENDLLNKFIVFLQNKEDFMQKAQQQSIWVKEKYSIEQYIINLKNSYKKNA